MKTARLAGLHIALAAMLLRAFLPDGWIPAPASRSADAGWLPLVICTSNGLVRLHEQGQDGQDDDQDHHYAPCPYAAAAHLAAPEAGATVELYETDFIQAPLAAGESILVERDRSERRQSRAPPFLKI